MEPLGARCAVRAWSPVVDGIDEVFHAHIADWSYPAHSHDTWTVLIVDRGAIDYSLDRRECAAVESTVAILPPGVVHDGRPASRARDGFWKRNLYLHQDLLPVEVVGAAVDKTVIHDRSLWRALSRLHHSLDACEDPLDAESRLALVRESIVGHLDRNAVRAPHEPGIAHRLRLLLDEHTTDPLPLRDAATRLQRSDAHLIRSFRASFGVSPHAYVIGRRVDAARRLLLQGMPAGQVATTVGFFDQAHLTRHFKRHVSTTPGRFASRRWPAKVSRRADTPVGSACWEW